MKNYIRISIFLLALGGVVIGTGCATAQPTTTAWEYKIVRPVPNPGHSERQINELASEGWVVEFFHLGENNAGSYVLMKRPR